MQESTLNAREDTSLIKLNGTGIIPARYVRTTEEKVPEMVKILTPEKSLKDTLRQQLKDGTLSPEQAIKDAFPVNSTHIKDISLDALRIEALPTGFSFFDSLSVLKKGRSQLVVVGGRPGHGKSALLFQIAANVSQGGRVLAFGFEMDKRDIKARILSPRISVPVKKLMSEAVPDHKRGKAEDIFSNMDLHVYDDANCTINYVVQESMNHAQNGNVPCLVVVDYIQMMQDASSGDKKTAISNILGKLKQLATQFRCPVVMGAQLNRECERRGKAIELKKGIGDYRPMASDLANADEIVFYADTIVLISRHSEYDGTRQGEADVIVAKNRGDSRGECIFEFSGELCAFNERTVRESL